MLPCHLFVCWLSYCLLFLSFSVDLCLFWPTTHQRHHDPAVPVALPGLRRQPLAVDARAGCEVVYALKLFEPRPLCRPAARAWGAAALSKSLVSRALSAGRWQAHRGSSSLKSFTEPNPLCDSAARARGASWDGWGLSLLKPHPLAQRWRGGKAGTWDGPTGVPAIPFIPASKITAAQRAR